LNGSVVRSLRLRLDAAGVWAGGVAFAVLLGLLASTARSWAAPVVAVAVLALGAYYIRVLGLQVGLVVLLIVTSVCDHFTFSVGPLAMRAEQVAALLALVALAVTTIRAGRTHWVKPSAAEWLLLAWFACNVVSSLIASPDRRLSAKILALIGICSLGLFLPRRLLAGSESNAHLETVIRWLLIVFATEAGYGTAMYLLHIFGPTISIARNPASGHLGAYGTLWEQNVFGGFAAAGAVAWIYLGRGRFQRPWLGLTACVGGLFDSVTRAAWLVAALVGLLGLIVPGLRRRLDPPTLRLGALGGLALVVTSVAVERIGKYTIQPPASGGGGSLLSAILNLVDVLGRFNQIGPVWADLNGHLVLGRGTASYEALHVAQGAPEHIASLPLLVLNDTGVVGLALFFAFAVAVFARAWSQRRSDLVVALGQVALVIGLTNLATETTELMVGWLLIGILLAAADGVSAQPSHIESAANTT
jgi:hypothetical protein